MRIGIDLRRADQLEAHLPGEGDRVVLTHVAFGGFGILRPIGATAMIFDAENSAGLQGPEARGQYLALIPRLHPVVQIAKSKHEVGCAGGGDLVVALARVVSVMVP